MTVERNNVISNTKAKLAEDKPSSMKIVIIDGKEVLALNTETTKKEVQK